jgi:hypothetical protein
MISADPGGGADFSHPWQPSLSGIEAAFLPGMVNRVAAKIGGVELDGGSGGEPPVLDLSRPLLDADGRGWFCAEVTVDPEKEWGIAGVEMVQVADPDTDDGLPGRGINAIGGAKPLASERGAGTRARHPVAMLRRRADGSLEVFEIAFFDLQMRIAFATDHTPQRYFFY